LAGHSAKLLPMTKQYELYEARKHSGIPNTTSSPSPEERGRVSKARGCLARQGVGRKRAVGQEVAGKERCSGEGSQREGWKKLNSGTQPDRQIDKLSCCLASLLSSNTIWIICPSMLKTISVHRVFRTWLPLGSYKKETEYV